MLVVCQGAHVLVGSRSLDFTGCQLLRLSYSTIRHTAVAAVLWRLFRKIGWETHLKEQAGWVVGAPNLQPFDVPTRPDSSTPWIDIDAAVAKPSQHGYFSTGQRYLKKAAAAARHVHKKQTNHGRLLTQHSIRYLVSCTPLCFEVIGGFSKKVCTLLSGLLESEGGPKATLSATK